MYPGGDMIWMALGWTIALVVIAALFWIVLNAFHSPSQSHESPEKNLKRRLATGEIDADEYSRQIARLSKTKRAA